MTGQFVSLAIIVFVAFASPYVASLIPGRPIPETVFLVFAGAILGPNCLDLIKSNATSIQLLSQLGLAFLFLMAGYELDPKELTGPMGKHAAASWAVSLVLALLVTSILPIDGLGGIGSMAFAIAMTTTAFGTLAPILRDRGLMGTPVGEAVTVYGAYGELLPVLAMAFLLSSRSPILTFVILGVFLLICRRVAKLPVKAKAVGSKVIGFLQDNVETGSQAPVRLTVCLLVFLVTLSAVFDLDIVLGAFAAGFILRIAVPEEDRTLMSKLEGIAFGFLVPLFFVVSGAGVDLSAAFGNPVLLVSFMGLLLVVRALPVWVSLKVSPETRAMRWSERFATAIYCSMALPIIVAVTAVAVENGAMTEDMASVLVTAGACTVLVVPIVTSLTRLVGSAHIAAAVGEIAHDPDHIGEIVHEHALAATESNRDFHHEREEGAEDGRRLSSADWLARERSVADRMRRSAEERKEQDE
ncbi:MAG: cation:proton antiporter [Atopobiaceae bacterium]|nr:cation:proton antiporter [Atopobiaceae bacterium]MCI2173483.1 cation:proton antiporter [Atopobiaceae bacterium]MCI2207478.1 cation:proton antiporter [Atopobiaceae bacterium]